MEPLPLPIKPGDVVVESVGAVVRFWVKLSRAEGSGLRCVGESKAWNRTRYYWPNAGQPVKAPEATVARLFPRKPEDWAESAATVRRLVNALPWATVHYFYAGHGPSGQYWGMPRFRPEDPAPYRSVAGCAEPVPECCCPMVWNGHGDPKPDPRRPDADCPMHGTPVEDLNP